jgi:anti-anti-sigma factor
MMATTPFDASVIPSTGGATIRLRGEIDRGAAAELDRAFTATAEHPGDVHLDFADVGYINSSGIALIVGLLARARQDGRKVSASGLSTHYREIFEITRLSDFMTILDDTVPAPSPTADLEGSR